MTQKNRVFGIIYESENNTLYHGTASFRDKLKASGYDAQLLDLKDPANFGVLYKALGAGECAFAFGLQGVGSQLHFKDQNLWHVAKTPFISLHFDHPSHALPNHVTASPYIANLYCFGTFLDDFEKYVKPIKNEPRVSGRISIDSRRFNLEPVPFEKRPIKYLFMKTGVSVAPYANHINTLPKMLRDGVWDRLDAARKDPNLSLCDLASSLFPKETFMDPNNQVEFWAMVKAMDLYLRHERAISMVNWLKHQKDAVILGNGWDEIDKEGAQAAFKPSVSAAEAYQLYRDTQFICNTSPYGYDVIHERIILGLMHQCAIITDRNAWIDQNLASTPNLIGFDWQDKIDDVVLPHVADIAQSHDNLKIGQEKAFKLFTGQDSAEQVCKAVEAVNILINAG